MLHNATMHKKIFLSISFLLVGLIVGAFSRSILSQVIGPSKEKTKFVQACGLLNGKELTYSNITSLNGNCYVDCKQQEKCGTVGKCEEKHILQFQELKNRCGEPEINKLDTEDIVYDSTKNYEPIDPYYRCVDNFLKEDQTSNLSINPRGTFSVSQKGLDNAWVCRISIVNSKIRAVPSFLYD